MSKERKVTEPKLSKCGTMVVRTVKVGNKILGTIESAKGKPGERPQATYWSTEALIRVSEREGGLLVLRTVLQGLRSYAVHKVGLRLPDGTKYMARLEDLTDPTKVDMVSHKLFLVAKNELWEVERPPMEDAVKSVIAKMRIAGRNSQSSVTALK